MKSIYFSLCVLASFLIVLEEFEKSKTDQEIRETIDSRLDSSALYSFKRSNEDRHKALDDVEGLPDR